MVESKKYSDPWLLVDGVIEFKFKSKVPPAAVFGLVYEKLTKRYPVQDNLPIMQLPESARIADANLVYSPYYQFSNEEFILEIGPRVILLKNKPETNGQQYAGWKKYLKELSFIYKVLSDNDIIGEFERIGVRYLNFFQGKNMFEESRLKFTIDVNNLEVKNSFLGLELDKDGFTSRIQIVSGATISGLEDSGDGSVIDIDSFLEDKALLNDGEIIKRIDEAHTVLKSLLFEEILTEEYIESTK